MPHCFNAHPGLGRSVGLFGLLVNPANLLEQHTVLLAALGLFTSGPVVIPAAADLQNSAHALELKLFAVRLRKGVLHLSSLTKYAAAFFKISRSSLTCSSSWRNRLTSWLLAIGAHAQGRLSRHAGSVALSI